MADAHKPVSTEDVPPPFEPTNVIELVSVTDSRIMHVSLYSQRAEITRLYKFPVKMGQNQVNITGLPNVLDRDSIRVEGRGAATIHEVTLSDIPVPLAPSSTERLDELLAEKELSEKALARAKKSLSSLEGYLSTLDAQHTDVDILDKVIEHYDSSGGKLDRKIMELEKTIRNLDNQISEERVKGVVTPHNEMLGLSAAIGVFASSEGEVAIALIYAVSSASWNASYDIRVDMQTKEKPVTLIYKASIKQNTGESWDDVALTLETASPTFGVKIPTLYPWRLSVYRPIAYKSKFQAAERKALRAPSMQMPHAGARAGGPGGGGHLYDDASEDAPFIPYDGIGGADSMQHSSLAVMSKGGVSATFQVPGSITIPSDGAMHNVTVAQLKLDADMSWVTVPKIDAKTHLKAKVKNASEYTLLHGTASVYVDGSFISKSDVPLVSPMESFECPLGLDPSIRITYHPLSKKVTHSGFYSKTSNYVFSQRITIHNTKTTSIDDFRVIDHVPISENSQITVKLVSPGLVIPEQQNVSLNKERELRPLAPIKIGEGVVAQWEGADEMGFDMEALGRDGKFHWDCVIPSQGKVNLLLSWEVTAPLRTQITGL